MDIVEFDEAKACITVKHIEFETDAVVIKSILNKPTGHIRMMSFYAGEGLTERTAAFDTFVQIIGGQAEIRIRGICTSLVSGESMVIPAHARHSVKSNSRFKMMLTVI